MDIRQMQALTMVISTGNLSVAAEKIHVTPQALSKTVAQLERELGVTLFDRRKNKLIPTPVGVQIAQECAQLLREYQLMQMKIRSHINRARGEFHVALAQGTLMILGETLFDDFVRDHPQYHPLYLDFPDQIAEDWLVSGRSLLAVTTAVPQDDAYMSVVLREGELCAVLSDAHPLASLPALTLSDLATSPVLSKNSLFTSYHTLEREAQRAGVRLNYALTSNDEVHWSKLVLQGRGVGIGVNYPGRGGPTQRGMVYRPIRPRIPWTLYLCWRREDDDSPIVRDFARFVQERSAAQVQQAGG